MNSIIKNLYDDDGMLVDYKNYIDGSCYIKYVSILGTDLSKHFAKGKKFPDPIFSDEMDEYIRETFSDLMISINNKKLGVKNEIN